MKIAVNTLSVTPQRGGVKTYLVNLMINLGKIDSENTYVVFVSYLNKGLFEGLGGNFKIVALPLYRNNRIVQFFYEQFAIPFYIVKYKIDLLFSPSNTVTIFPFCKQVLTFHALLMVRKLRKQYPEKTIPKLHSLLYNLMFPLSLRCSDKIIAVSQNTKKWLLRQRKVLPSKIAVVYEGVDCKLFLSMNSSKNVKTEQPYILFLSTLFGYKNADKLIQAFSKLKEKHKIPHKLKIAGRDPKNRIGLLSELAKSEGIFNDVIFTGEVPYEKVNSLYLNADVFVFPSAVETFGLPVLEAMACGTPVVASNRTSVPEIVGDAGVIVDPDDIDGLAEAILRALSDEELRRSLIQKGHQRAKKFSWYKTARKTLEVFEEVFNEG